MFGDYCLCGLVLLLAAALGSVGGFLTFHIKKGTTKKPAILIGIVIFLLTLFGAFGYYGLYLPNDYYRYAGAFDSYRMPLNYPYELSMIDTIDCASIGKWQEDQLFVTGISHYYIRDSFVVGKISDECLSFYGTMWFLFDTNTGKVTKFSTEEALHQAVEKLGFDEEPELLTVRENWDLYWENR